MDFTDWLVASVLSKFTVQVHDEASMPMDGMTSGISLNSKQGLSWSLPGNGLKKNWINDNIYPLLSCMKKHLTIFTDRMYREAETIKVMVGIYCRHHHGRSVAECSQCSQVQNYALERLHHCTYQEGKTSCKNCPIHCYKKDMREKIKTIMRFSGPRMILRYPWFTLMHIVDRLNYRKTEKSLTT